MPTVKARVRTGEIFRTGELVSVIGDLQANGSYRYEVRKPFQPLPGAYWTPGCDTLTTIGLGITGSTFRNDAGLGAIWCYVRLLDRNDPETARRIRELRKGNE